MSLKEKKLTENDVEFLYSEGWLTDKQKVELENYIGSQYTREQIEVLCADCNVVDLIFQYSVTPVDICYHVNCLSHGLYKEGKAEVFEDLQEAIKYHYKKSKEVTSMLWTIEVHYKEGK